MKIEYKDNIVKKVSDSIIMQTDSDYIDLTISMGQALSEQFNSINGMSYEFIKKDNTHINTIINVDYDKINIDQLIELLSEFSDGESDNDSFINNIKNKNLLLKEFKFQNLNGYSCESE